MVVERNHLNIADPRPLHVIKGDEPFPLKSFLVRPYAGITACDIEEKHIFIWLYKFVDIYLDFLWLTFPDDKLCKKKKKKSEQQKKQVVSLAKNNFIVIFSFYLVRWILSKLNQYLEKKRKLIAENKDNPVILFKYYNVKWDIP